MMAVVCVLGLALMLGVGQGRPVSMPVPAAVRSLVEGLHLQELVQEPEAVYAGLAPGAMAKITGLESDKSFNGKSVHVLSHRDDGLWNIEVDGVQAQSLGADELSVRAENLELVDVHAPTAELKAAVKAAELKAAELKPTAITGGEVVPLTLHSEAAPAAENLAEGSAGTSPAATSAGTDTTVADLSPGDQVVIQGLERAADYNGRGAVLQQLRPDGLWQLKVEDVEGEFVTSPVHIAKQISTNPTSLKAPAAAPATAGTYITDYSVGKTALSSNAKRAPAGAGDETATPTADTATAAASNTAAQTATGTAASAAGQNVPLRWPFTAAKAERAGKVAIEAKQEVAKVKAELEATKAELAAANANADLVAQPKADLATAKAKPATSTGTEAAAAKPDLAEPAKATAVGTAPASPAAAAAPASVDTAATGAAESAVVPAPAAHLEAGATVRLQGLKNDVSLNGVKTPVVEIMPDGSVQVQVDGETLQVSKDHFLPVTAIEEPSSAPQAEGTPQAAPRAEGTPQAAPQAEGTPQAAPRAEGTLQAESTPKAAGTKTDQTAATDTGAAVKPHSKSRPFKVDQTAATDTTAAVKTDPNAASSEKAAAGPSTRAAVAQEEPATAQTALASGPAPALAAATVGDQVELTGLKSYAELNGVHSAVSMTFEDSSGDVAVVIGGESLRVPKANFKLLASGAGSRNDDATAAPTVSESAPVVPADAQQPEPATQLASSAPAPEAVARLGTTIELQNLNNFPQYNGKQAVVSRMLEDGAVEIQMDGQEMAVKPNFYRVQSESAPVVPTDAQQPEPTTQLASSASAPEAVARLGATIELQNLNNFPQYNGKQVVVSHMLEDGAVEIQVDGQEMVVKPHFYRVHG